MHVALLGNFPEDLDHPAGGVESVAACLAVGLLRSGVELSLVCYGAASNSDSRHRDLGCRVIGLPRVWPAGLTFSTLTPFAAQHALRRLRPDLVHVQGLPELYRGGSIPSVLTIHGIPYEDARYRGGLLGGLAPRLRARGFHRALARYTSVIAISPYVLAEIGEGHARSARSIPNPVDPRFFEVERAPEPDRVLCVGVIDRRKNARCLVEAAARVRETRPDVRYRMAGPMDPAYEPELMTAIEACGLVEQFEFLGSIDRSRLLGELASCSALVLPSLQETAPMAIQEAMAAGVPVAAAAVGGIPQMLEDGRSGLLFDPLEPAALARQLTLLLGDEARRESLGKAARAHAEANFRSDKVVAATLEVYEAAIRAGSGPAV